MTDHLAPDPEHRRVWEALPWVANGRATPEQAAWVEAHLAGCDDCAAEWQLQQRLRDALCPAPELAGVGDAAAERGLQRLLARLDDVPEQAASVAAAPRRLTMALAAAVVVQAVGLGALSLRLWSGDGDGAGDYRTLSTAGSISMAPATLRVLPDAAMTLADWNALLRAQGLQIVGGPNAAGAFALAPAPGAPATPRAEALARLRSQAGIRLAEPIGDTP